MNETETTSTTKTISFMSTARLQNGAAQIVYFISFVILNTANKPVNSLHSQSRTDLEQSSGRPGTTYLEIVSYGWFKCGKIGVFVCYKVFLPVRDSRFSNILWHVVAEKD